MLNPDADLFKSPETTENIWDSVLYTNLDELILEDSKKLSASKLSFAEGLPQDIRLCKTGAILERKTLETLLNKVSKGLSDRDNKKLVAFVANSLQKGKIHLGWDVAIPSRPFRFYREPSCFRPDRFVLLHKARKIQQAVIDLPYTDDRKVECGRVILSAILFGGLVDKQWISSWLIALEERQVFSDQRYLWLEIEKVIRYANKANDKIGDKKIRGENEQDIIIHRRWFADSVSRLLICRWLNQTSVNKHVINNSSWQSSIQCFLKSANLEDCLKNSLSDLLAMGEMALRLETPQNIASYATGVLNSVSLPEPVWTRILSGKAVYNQRSGHKEREDITQISDTHSVLASMSGHDSPADQSLQHEYFKKVRKLLSGKSPSGLNRESIKQRIREIIQTAPLSEINRLLLEWSIYLLSLEASTALRYLGAIGSYLIAACEKQEFVEQEPPWFEAQYERALSNIKMEKEKIFARKTMGRFHRFLVAKYGAPDLGKGFFAGRVGPAEYTVDANLITCTEFDLIKRALGGDDPKRPRVATAVLLIAILGFRCGLRRNEAYYLRVRDIQGDRYPEIVLRPYSKRGLKSGASTRRIPLHILLNKDEQALLKAWCNERAVNGNTPLFSKMSRSFTMYKPEQLFGPVRVALHQITGDESLRYHHLRHSFTNWIFIRLNGDAEGLRNRASFLDHSEFDKDRVLELRQTLLGNELLGRKGAFAAALLCGHADPATTFKSYIHLSDFMLGEQLVRLNRLTSLSIQQISNLSGLPVPTLYNYYDRRNGADRKSIFLVAIKKSKIKESASMPIAFNYNDVTIDYDDVERFEMRWMAITRALSQYQIDLLPPNTISETLGYPEETIQSWITNASYIANLKVSETHGGYRHRVVAQHLELSGHDPEGREIWSLKEGITVKSFKRKPRHSSGPRAKKPEDRKSEWKKSISQQVHPTHFPVAPRLVSDRELMQRIMGVFEGSSKEERDYILDFADFFCERLVLNSGGIWYEDVAWAKRHLHVIRMLGIPISHVRLLDLETEEETVAESKKRRKDLEKALEINNAIWINTEIRKSMKRIRCSFGIRILSSAGGNGSYAFRYSMYLIRIGYWE